MDRGDAAGRTGNGLSRWIASVGYGLLAAVAVIVSTVAGQAAAFLAQPKPDALAALSLPEAVYLSAAFLQALVLILPGFILALLVLVWVRLVSRGSYLGVGPFTAQHLGAGLLTGTAVCAILVSSAYLSGAAVYGGRSGLQILPLILAIQLVGWMAFATAQELLFRGWLYDRCRRIWPLPAAIAVSAAIFAAIQWLGTDRWLLHVSTLGLGDMPPLAMLNAVLLGLWLGILRLRTGSIWTGVGAIAMWHWLERSVFGLAPVGTFTSAMPWLNLDFSRDPTAIGGALATLDASPVLSVLLGLLLATEYWRWKKARR